MLYGYEYVRIMGGKMKAMLNIPGHYFASPKEKFYLSSSKLFLFFIDKVIDYY